ncbi:HDOD domain-containing protein [Desulfuromusa kysingii]|nr:HDOD domain-containing protein [Desulfuromusa kysingii]
MKASFEILSEQDVMDLLCMPQVLIDLIEACLSGSDEQSLTDIVLHDAVLSARIILAASKSNSQPLDPFEPVSSAVKQLGVAVITGIALQSARQVIQHDFTPQQLSFQYGLWFSSQVSGIVARCLAPSVNYPHIEEAQLCGLLQNLGIYAMFFRAGDNYVRLDVHPWSSAVQCQLEEAEYQVDHLQVAAKLVGPWNLDSFLVDTIRFLYADLSQIEGGHPLLKIARLTQQFCQSPKRLFPETEELAEHLFGLTKNEIDYLSAWAKGLYPHYGDALNDLETLQKEMAAACERLTELSFVLATQEAIRSRLGLAQNPKELVSIARQLYLENSPANEAIFLLLDQQHFQLTGILSDSQPRLIGELKVSMEAQSNLLAAALQSGKVTDSFHPLQPLTVDDHVLIRLAKGAGISCQPFLFDGRALGVVVLGIDSTHDLQRLESLPIKMFVPVVSAAMMKMSVDAQNYVTEGGSLLRRVSHEVKNPLTIIGNYTEVLNHSLAGTDNQELTQSIQKEVRRIDDILNYYLNQQEIPGFPEPSIDLNQLVLDTIDAVDDGELQSRQVEIRLDLQDKLENVATNPVLVKQILVNLLKNAAAAVSEKGIIQLLTRAGYSSDNGRHIEVIVADNGPGLSTEQQEQLFQPVVGHEKETGLSVIKGMVDDLGGRISCHSSRESGTSFHLQIPCRIVRQLKA